NGGGETDLGHGLSETEARTSRQLDDPEIAGPGRGFDRCGAGAFSVVLRRRPSYGAVQFAELAVIARSEATDIQGDWVERLPSGSPWIASLRSQ
ncbi:hypothetical protein, partial [Bosea thiooxidans]